jgi:hypothetical protein
MPMKRAHENDLVNESLRVEVQDDPTRKWLFHTPAMASGLTDHISIVEKLLLTVKLSRVLYTLDWETIENYGFDNSRHSNFSWVFRFSITGKVG